ncbi:unnamed protein product [Peronospora farinosa]|uniref:Uncharacterized protein n=1 Tax=Peronospora farinosa TaxID=134698 RepID=A0ABN8CIU5_9STRA|nr:unnamed protein product [Peronospora farinosa]
MTMQISDKVDVDYVPVEAEPLHKQRWRSENLHEKGSVFCRDHTKDKLIHSAATLDKPAFLIEIELLKEKADVMPNEHLPLHPGIKNFKNDPECRVYGFELQNDDQAEIALNLPTEAVLVALDDCEVEITKASSNKQEDTTHQVVLKVGDDVQLLAGKFGIKFVSSASKKAQFHLVEVY